MDLLKMNTKGLRFDPKDPDFLGYFDDYPEFKVANWRYEFSRKVVLTYISIMYDPNSDLWNFVPNYWQRKREAGKMAGFPIIQSGVRQGMFSQEVEAILLGADDDINRMIVRFCTLFHDVEYLTLISYLELFVQETMRVMEDNESKESKTIIANIDSLNGKIRELTKNIFSGDESEKLKRELYRSVMNEMLKYRPELIARSLKDKKPPLESPYE